MEKLLYWLKKLGILRSGTYSAKGDAKKVNEAMINAELYKSQSEIDREQVEKSMSESGSDNEQKQQDPVKQAEKKGVWLFWVMCAVAFFFFLAFWGVGFSGWFLVALAMWAFYLWKLHRGAAVGTIVIGKMIGIGAVVIIASFILMDASLPTPEEVQLEYDSAMQNLESADGGAAEEESEGDGITILLRELQKETRIAFSEPQDDDITWFAQNVQLALTDGKSYGAYNLTSDDFASVQQFFLDRDANTGGVGFDFYPPEGTQSAGFVMTSGPYNGAMCVFFGTENEGILIGCGWGPGGPTK